MGLGDTTVFSAAFATPGLGCGGGSGNAVVGAVVAVDVEEVADGVADVVCDDLVGLSVAEAPMAVVAPPGVVLCRLIDGYIDR